VTDKGYIWLVIRKVVKLISVESERNERCCHWSFT